MKITPDIAARMYAIAVMFCGAEPSYADTFVRYATGGPEGEYRFGGNLGAGGKLRFEPAGWLIMFYPEDSTPERCEAILRANTALMKLWKEVK